MSVKLIIDKDPLLFCFEMTEHLDCAYIFRMLETYNIIQSISAILFRKQYVQLFLDKIKYTSEFTCSLNYGNQACLKETLIVQTDK